MNESQLRGWRPRQPSAGLKRQIFSGTGAEPAKPWNWNFAAPALVCGLFALLVIHFNGGAELRAPRPVMTMVLSNGTLAGGFSDRAQELQNHVATVTFDWTNHSGFQSSIGSQSGLVPSTNFSN